jgi:uncharacterized protein (DUF1800 family)
MKRLLVLASCALLLGSSNATLTNRQRAIQALDRLAFGPRPGDVERVMQIGVDRWIDEQLHPERIADRPTDARIANYETLSMSSRDIFDKFYKPIVEARRAKKNNANVEEMMRDIPRDQRPRRVIAELTAQRLIRATESERQLNEVMVDFWMNHFNVFAPKGLDRVLVTSYERDVVRPRIWGRFEDLLMATAKSPAMLFYLDNARSRGGALNENYAREIMELHTLGVDGGYTQKDVTELARVLTGWTIAREGQGFIFRPAFHDRGAKSVLGSRIAAGGGVEEGETMIRLLARHPATAHRIAYKLCQRFIADEPPASAVDRVAQTFLASRGDLRQTVKAVIDSAEFRDPKYFRAKVKTPFEYAVSAVRAVGGELIDPLPLARQLQQMGEGLYLSQPPTGYSDTAQAWVSTGGLMARLNFALALASNKLPGVRVDAAPFVQTALSGGDLSVDTRKTIKEQNADVPTVAGLILGSPEFQRQ